MKPKKFSSKSPYLEWIYLFELNCGLMGLKWYLLKKILNTRLGGIFNNTIIVILISKTISLSSLILHETGITVCSKIL